MSRVEKQLFEHLGPVGLSRVLSDLLDQNRLVRLANTCGLKYPGMRTRSQSREKILADLVERADKEEPTRKAIYRLLQKETRPARSKWKALSDGEKVQRLADRSFLLSNGNLGLHLYFLAALDGEKVGDGLDPPAARRQLLGFAERADNPKAKADRPSREQARRQKKVVELQKKIQHLETQLLKSRENEKTIKRDLIQRKGELAESRMLAERLRREADAAQTTARQANSAKKTAAPADEAIDKLSKALRRVASEQKKLSHRVEKLPEMLPATVRLDPEALSDVHESLKNFQKELGASRRERRKALQEQTKRLDELRAGLTARKDGTEGAGRAATRAVRRAAAKNGEERVGVFIDVQNVYYGARQLKGKLDFDALLDAAVGNRRLVQPTAYVVESKEIDQSDFIAVLEQRAIEVRRKNLQVRADGSMKGNWDMELALDILDAAPRLDVVVLVSGDGDFTSLVKRVKQMGPRVEVIGFPRTTAKSLVQAADNYQPLNSKFMISTGGSKAARRRAAGKRGAKAAPAVKAKSGEDAAAPAKQAAAERTTSPAKAG